MALMPSGGPSEELVPMANSNSSVSISRQEMSDSGVVRTISTTTTTTTVVEGSGAAGAAASSALLELPKLQTALQEAHGARMALAGDLEKEKLKTQDLEDQLARLQMRLHREIETATSTVAAEGGEGLESAKEKQRAMGEMLEYAKDAETVAVTEVPNMHADGSSIEVNASAQPQDSVEAAAAGAEEEAMTKAEEATTTEESRKTRAAEEAAVEQAE